MSPALLVAFAALGAADCGKGNAPSAPVASASASVAQVASAAGDDAGAPMDDREREAWAQAREGEAEELARLADLAGCEGLRERADGPELRMTAIRAMAYCADFSELPWLAGVAAGADGEQAMAALDSIVDLAARPRRSVDPEDAEELHEGCASLLALATSTDKPRERRVPAVRALRMLSERGCVERARIPSDLDAR